MLHEPIREVVMGQQLGVTANPTEKAYKETQKGMIILNTAAALYLNLITFNELFHFALTKKHELFLLHHLRKVFL